MRKPPAELRLYYLQHTPPQIKGISGRIQTYFPSLEQLFPSVSQQKSGSPALAAKELAVFVNSNTSVVEDILTKEQRETSTWIRIVHLVDPVDAMSGEIVLPEDGALPNFRSPWQRALKKINDPYNEAYTDAIFACMASRLVETGRSPHFCLFYGSYNARVPEYSYNITDDMSDVEGEDWFREGLKSGAFTILAVDPYNPKTSFPLSRPWEDLRPKLFGIQDNQTVCDTDTVATSSSSTYSSSSEASELEITEADIEVSGVATVCRPQIQLARIREQSRSISSGSSDSDEDIEYRAILKNFPVQMTVLERCDGSMDELMEDEIADDATDDMRETKEQRWTSWTFQVVAALTVAQQCYDFVHNDLHTNNVMWSGTGETHLYYHITGGVGGDRYYRVPTYGRIMKIIDFGRATYRPISAGENRTWFPDVYAPNAVAGGQYNCGPHYEHGRPKVLPNKSFDLCRLAVAMLDTLWENPVEIAEPKRVMTKEPGRTQLETKSPLWNLLWLWLTDKYGRNVLRSPDDSDRYPQFDLYCAIASDVQNAVPAQQLTLPLFDAAFRCVKKDIPADATVWKLHAINAQKVM